MVFVKLFEKLYAPLTSGILESVKYDQRLTRDKTTPLDNRYRRVVRALDDLVDAVGLQAA